MVFMQREVLTRECHRTRSHVSEDRGVVDCRARVRVALEVASGLTTGPQCVACSFVTGPLC